MSMAKKSLNVNGKRVSISYDDPQMPLLYALRDNLGLHGPRFGCGYLVSAVLALSTLTAPLCGLASLQLIP
jgi:hypothetical protein